MNFLKQFILYLVSQKKTPSRLTVKNYKADVGQFIGWFEKKFFQVFDPTKITIQTLCDYKKERNLSKNSLKRHESSLKKFFIFLATQGIFNPELLTALQYKKIEKNDPLMLKNFKNSLLEYKKSKATIKNYSNDIKNFFSWLNEVALTKYSWDTKNKDLLNKINHSVLEEYKQRLLAIKFSPKTINRKLSSLRNYIQWAKSQGIIQGSQPEKVIIVNNPTIAIESPLPEEDNKAITEPQESFLPPVRLAHKSAKIFGFLFDNLLAFPIAKIISNLEYLLWKITGKNIFSKEKAIKSTKKIEAEEISNIKKVFYAPLDVSVRYMPLHQKIWHHLRFTRPKWYKIYHSYPITHYLHFAVLVILSCAISFGVYNNLIPGSQKNNVLGITTNDSSRTLSFQGKLTDVNGQPINKETNVSFALYNEKNASSSANIWQEQNTVLPDANGNFSILLGKKTLLPETIFNQNPRLFLGIAIDNEPELNPRQQIATVSLASNSQMLQSLEPITNSNKTANVILALDSSGNLNIAGAQNHTFQTIGGEFILSGKVLTLTTTPGSNSNIQIAPDGNGIIDLTRPIQNTSEHNSMSSFAGSVEFDDSVAILATTSAQSALDINQNSSGKFISASSMGIAKFSLENDGTGRFAGNLNIDGGNLTTTNSVFNLFNSSPITLNLGDTNGATIIKSKLSINNELTLPLFTSNGGILYTNGSGKVLQISSGSDSDCLLGGSTPTFKNCGNVIGQLSKVGIGTTNPLFKLDIHDSQDSTAAAYIYNTSANPDADGLIIRLGNASGSAVATTNRFISFETDGIGIAGSIRGNGSAGGVTYLTSDTADFAEYLKKDQSQTIEYGSVVCLDQNGMAIKCGNNNKKIVGVASEKPAFLGGKNLGKGSIEVGLIGQIETLVALTEDLKPGDNLTSSGLSGIATKATDSGLIIGKTLTGLSSHDEEKIVGYFDPDSQEYKNKIEMPNIPLKSNIVKVAKIPVLVSISWYDPNAYLAQNGELAVQNTSPDEYIVSTLNGEKINKVDGFLKIIAGNIKTGIIKASKTITDTLIVASDSIIVNGQNLKDYIISVVTDSKIESNLSISNINTHKLSSDIISPLSSSSLSIRLASPSGLLVIQNASGSAVAQIDNQGNASFSGTLNSLALQTNEASISGTLRAGNILADSISGLDERISNIYSHDFADLASYSAQLSYVPDLLADRAQFNQGLMVFGPTSLADLSVTDRLSIGGSMFITQNSLETMGTDLSLQSLRQGGLSIMGGLVYIDTDGNLKIEGDLSINGKLAVNVISPLPTSDLVINNASGSSILSVNHNGDIAASGSGTFTKLKFNLVQPVLALSPTEVIASSSAGITDIAPYQSEVTIRNGLVTDKSVIYITPVGTPSAQTPFLMRQTPQESFTVGVQSPTNHPIKFNWLIVN